MNCSAVARGCGRGAAAWFPARALGPRVGMQTCYGGPGVGVRRMTSNKEDSMKMLISQERLWQKIESDPDLDVEAGLPIAASREADKPDELGKRCRLARMCPPDSSVEFIRMGGGFIWCWA